MRPESWGLIGDREKPAGVCFVLFSLSKSPPVLPMVGATDTSCLFGCPGAKDGSLRRCVYIWREGIVNICGKPFGGVGSATFLCLCEQDGERVGEIRSTY